jgi:phosphatidylglycerol---prolipoprotein diacylglyceryl transferase
MVGLATIHHPLLIAAGAVLGGLAGLGYARWQRMPILSTADALAAPLTLGLACEQFGTLLAGSGYGKGTHLPWAVVYTDALAARWSGVSLGIPLHPVQAYAAIAFLTLSILLLVLMPVRRQQGDVAGVALMGAGVAVFVTEFWRDWEGRGAVLRGVLDGPQVAAIVMVIFGAVLLRERVNARIPAHDAIEANHA